MDDARPADVIIVMGAAEYRGAPSPVLKLRLDHAVQLYRRKLAPYVMTTGGPGGDPSFTEGGVGRSYLVDQGVHCGVDHRQENSGDSTVYSLAAASRDSGKRCYAQACVRASWSAMATTCFA